VGRGLGLATYSSARSTFLVDDFFEFSVIFLLIYIYNRDKIFIIELGRYRKATRSFPVGSARKREKPEQSATAGAGVGKSIF
jgi:hypothetical protein